jgi:Protein of unknown function (DUF732)
MGDSTVRIALIALAMAAVAAALPATAHADEGSYLDRVHAAGIPVTDDKALTLGRAACIDLSKDIPLSAVLAAQNPAMGGAALTAEQNWQLRLFRSARGRLDIDEYGRASPNLSQQPAPMT